MLEANTSPDGEWTLTMSQRNTELVYAFYGQHRRDTPGFLHFGSMKNEWDEIEGTLAGAAFNQRKLLPCNGGYFGRVTASLRERPPGQDYCRVVQFLMPWFFLLHVTEWGAGLKSPRHSSRPDG